MDTVIDHLQPTIRVLNERKHRPGRTMMHPRHPIEGVSEEGRPGLDRRSGLFKGRRGMTDCHDHTRLAQDARRLGGVSPLGRHRDLAQSAVARDQKPLDQVRIRIAKEGRIVCPAVLAGEEWALEVDPEDCGSRRVSAAAT